MAKLTFTHRFSRTLSCTLRVEDQPPEAGAVFQPVYEWTGQPKRKHVNEYRRWIL